ncbi:unnamed protein product [Orchesella dallaii]|uniref:Uncharacterized protein n=1 Tax=Orchesella dallaii TaxID=48710 RepID=A0ABP1RHA5_9HEXA
MTHHFVNGVYSFPRIHHCYSRFKRQNRASICNSKLMTLLTLIDYNTANRSLNTFWKATPQVLQSMGKNLHEPFHIRSEVLTEVQLLTEHYKAKYLTTQIYPQRFLTNVPVYCIYRKGRQGFRIVTLIWIEALPADVWGPMGVLLLLVLVRFLLPGYLQIPRKLKKYFWKYFGAFQKKFEEIKSLMEFVILSGAMFFGFCYENELTSLVTVAPIVPAYSTFVELLHANYKVLERLRGYSAKTVYEIYSHNLKLIGISNNLERYFHVYDKNLTRDEEMNYMVDKLKMGEKLMYVADDELANAYIRLYTKQLLNTARNDVEVVVMRKESLFAKWKHWKIGTKNRYWMMRTIKMIYESGLYVKWDEWAKRKWDYLHDITESWEVSEPITSEYITTPEFVSVMLVFSFFILIGTMIFIWEVYYPVKGRVRKIKIKLIDLNEEFEHKHNCRLRPLKEPE